MIGITEFNDAEHALHCRDVATKRLKKIKTLFLPTLLISVIIFITYFMGLVGNHKFIANTICNISLICAWIMLCYSGSIMYFGKFLTIPFRKFGGVFGLIIFLCLWAVIAIVWVLCMFPFGLMWYAKSLCERTLVYTEDLI